MGKSLIGLLVGSIFIFLLLPGGSVAQAAAVRQDVVGEWGSTLLAQASPAPDRSPVSSTSVAKDNASASIVPFLSLAVSLFSLVVAATVAYVSNFSKAEIKLLVGRNIVFFSPPGTVAGDDVGFNIPVTFYNWSVKGGTIDRIRLVISRQGQDDYYDMVWTTFVKIDDNGINVIIKDEDLAQPIPVQGRSSVNKFIRFDWTLADGGRRFPFQNDNYELNIFTWMVGDKKPSLHHKFLFVVEQEAYLKYQESVNNKTNIPIWISFKEREKPNQFLTRSKMEDDYFNKK